MADSRDPVLPAADTATSRAVSRTRSSAVWRCGASPPSSVELRWSIGMTILERQKIDQWGSGGVGRTNDDLFAAEVRRELAAAARRTPTFDWEQP